MRCPRALVLLLGLFLGFGLAIATDVGAASAQKTGRLDMKIANNAILIDGGRSARLTVTASCPVGGELLESFVYVNQGGSSTQFGAVNVPCDGRRHEVTVTVTALDFELEEGKASASGFMLLTSGESISPVRKIRLRP